MRDVGLKLEMTIGTDLMRSSTGTGNLLTLTPTSPIEAVPRVLFVDNQVSDFLRYRIAFACKLREAGFDVHVALPREPGLEDICQEGIPVHIFYIQRKSTRLLDELRCWFSLLRLYRRL